MSHGSENSNGFADAVTIKVDKVFDSCSGKDCFNDLPVTLTCQLPDSIAVVKTKCVTVSSVCMNIEPIPFNKGFFSVDLTFTFSVELLGYTQACGTNPIPLCGTAYANKSCILYGSESATKTFFSDSSPIIGATNECCETATMPTASVQVVNPIALETRIGNICVPSPGTNAETEGCTFYRTVFITLGLFSVVELTRPVTILVPTFEYTIPHKECSNDTDSPCEIFERMNFPVDEFAPTDAISSGSDNRCGCES
jgi:hypothetical protein